MGIRDEVKMQYKKLINATSHFFPKKGKLEQVPKEKGVYIILSPEDEVLHVGKARAQDGIREGLEYHMDLGSPFTDYYLGDDGKDLRKGYKFKYIEEEDDGIRDYLKVYATATLLRSGPSLP